MTYLVLVEEGDRKSKSPYVCPVYSRQHFERKKAKNIRCVLMQCETNSPVFEDWTMLEDFYPKGVNNV